ncbi:MAG: hypothetical protein LBQ50_02635 [Planctomycetaceae bacterium]|jgi:proteasome lid subunit RPN8/RPN11|nr:hypothetical protein [Planctomycetaceae bacterium]
MTFIVKKVTKAVPLENKQELLINDYKKQQSSVCGTCADGEHILYFTPKSLQQLNSHIQWGQRTSANIIEQGGILVGCVSTDDKNTQGINCKIMGVVHAIIYGKVHKGNSSTYLSMTTEIWAEMYQQFDRDYANQGLSIIGWYHTHPNNLDVFMSVTDIDTQKKFFVNDWQFAVVLNPHRKIWKSFYGKSAIECRSYFLYNDELKGTAFDLDVPVSIPSTTCQRPSLPSDVQNVSAEETINVSPDVIKTVSKLIKSKDIFINPTTQPVKLGFVYQNVVINTTNRAGEKSINWIYGSPLLFYFWYSDNCPPIVVSSTNYQLTPCPGQVKIMFLFSANRENNIEKLQRQYPEFSVLVWVNINNLRDYYCYDLRSKIR